VLILVVLVGAGFALLASADNQGGKSGENQVAICHYPGHQGDFVIQQHGCGCWNTGGKVIIVGRSACENGHKATAPAGGGDKTCASDNTGDLWEPEQCYDK
jgi:hypothetical protein